MRMAGSPPEWRPAALVEVRVTSLAAGRVVTGRGVHQLTAADTAPSEPERPVWGLPRGHGEPANGQRPGPKPPAPRPGRTPIPDAGPPRPPGL